MLRFRGVSLFLPKFPSRRPDAKSWSISKSLGKRVFSRNSLDFLLHLAENRDLYV